MELRRQLSFLEKDTARDNVRERRNRAVIFLNELGRGDVFVVGNGRRSHVPYVVIDTARDIDDPRPRVMSTSKQVKRIGQEDLDDDGRFIGRVNLPPTFDSRSVKTRNWLSDQIEQLARKTPKIDVEKRSENRTDIEIARLRKALRAHVCHGCNDREAHVRWFERVSSTQRDIARLETKVEQRTSSIARDFDRICAVLTSLGYLAKIEGGHEVTASGAVLGRIYCELDLLVAECLTAGIWEGLEPDQLASAVSTLVFESRRDNDGEPARIPEGNLGDALYEMAGLWGSLKDVESQNRVDHLREMDPGFIWPTSKWARGQDVARVLKNSDLQPGDFVRWTKQVIDLLSQIAIATETPEIASSARKALDQIDRGIVAW